MRRASWTNDENIIVVGDAKAQKKLARYALKEINRPRTAHAVKV